MGTPQQPIEVSNGSCCSDLTAGTRIDPTIAVVQDKALTSFKGLLNAWPEHKRELKGGIPP